MSVKRIGVLTSGGDAPGMNAAVRAVVRTCLYHGIEVYGIRRGWNGLIHGDIIKMDASSVSRTINRGGTFLYTARSKEFMTEEGQKRAVSTCKFLGLDSIIAIGGDLAAEAYSLKGGCYFWQGQAIVEENSTLQIDDPKYNTNEAKIKELFEKAVPFYEKAKELEPDNKQLWGQILLTMYWKLNSPKYGDLEKELGY